jgi:hypothetical protein
MEASRLIFLSGALLLIAIHGLAQLPELSPRTFWSFAREFSSFW